MNIKNLLEQQKIARASGDMQELSRINKQIYLFREKRRKAEELQKEIEKENRQADLIEQILTR